MRWVRFVARSVALAALALVHAPAASASEAVSCAEQPLPLTPAQANPASHSFGFSDGNALRRAMPSGSPPEQQRVAAEWYASLAATAGAHVMRVDLSWVEIERDDDGWVWSNTNDADDRYDQIYCALLRHNIQPLWIAQQAPDWAVDPLRPSCGGVAGCERPRGPPTSTTGANS